MQELAEDIGIARSTLYEWRALESFGEYVNYLTDLQLSAMRTEVNVAIMKAIRGGPNGVPSVKAIDLYMRRFGLLTDRTVVEDTRDSTHTRQRTDEEIRADIAELDAMINGESPRSVRTAGAVEAE
ncbi:phBC6A51 family helix-turn-helix protein [Paenibacillaceae bacterium WGS1546]|uniref:phBC6A51 family helix-turn-helix protein n=1 Tax=Cohnella sp. WGS1546 TaxID=3366810 RepID=UPI00372CEFFF